MWWNSPTSPTPPFTSDINGSWTMAKQNEVLLWMSWGNTLRTWGTFFGNLVGIVWEHIGKDQTLKSSQILGGLQQPGFLSNQLLPCVLEAQPVSHLARLKFEPAPTSVPWRMDDKWSRRKETDFSVGFQFPS
jgi:hypothetical protein